MRQLSGKLEQALLWGETSGNVANTSAGGNVMHKGKTSVSSSGFFRTVSATCAHVLSVSFVS